jgi:hypothetical protein
MPKIEQTNRETWPRVAMFEERLLAWLWAPNSTVFADLGNSSQEALNFPELFPHLILGREIGQTNPGSGWKSQKNVAADAKKTSLKKRYI